MQGRIPGPAPAGLTVFETMRREADGSIALWPLHLARLARGCAAVGYPLDADAIVAALAEVPTGSPLRLRLSVAATGKVSAEAQPLPPPVTEWRVTLSSVRLSSADPWLRFKTSHRPAYDAARRGLPAGRDEAILLNERGEVCEGTISNLFLRRGSVLLTPPVACGLLPGVLRESLLATGQAEEAVLHPADLENGELLMGNALRGLVRACLAKV